MTRLVCTSDMHGKLSSIKIPEGDVLVLAGDILKNFYMGAPDKDASRQLRALEDFLGFLDRTSFKKVVMIAGNHDWVFQLRNEDARKIVAMHPKTIYLQDEGATVEGLKFWGSPHQPEFCDWAFNEPRDGKALAQAWSQIPEGLDVLVTHGPPFGIMDSSPTVNCHEVGCRLLLERIQAVKPRWSVFGHIHGAYGRKKIGETEFLNVSLCDERYEPVQTPQVIEVEPR